MSSPRWTMPGVEATWCAGRIGDVDAIGGRERDRVTPASVMKIQVALAAASAMEDGRIDGTARVTLPPERRTPGPVGMSLFADTVELSLRDLLVPMMTISDNVATDALLEIVDADVVNASTAALGLADTFIAGNLATMLDGLGRECGFADYAGLAAHDPHRAGPPSRIEVLTAIAGASALDPERGSRTTAADTVRLLRLVWADSAGPVAACRRIRLLMAEQLTRNRIASGFGPGWSVAAKSGGLMGIVRNEAGVVTTPDGTRVAVAIFTRRDVGCEVDPARIDTAIGRLARELVDELR